MGSSIQPTVPLSQLIPACKGAGLDVSDAEWALDGAGDWDSPDERQQWERAAYAACVVAAMGAGYRFALTPWASEAMRWDCYYAGVGSNAARTSDGPTAPDALFAALGGKL